MGAEEGPIGSEGRRPVVGAGGEKLPLHTIGGRQGGDWRFVASQLAHVGRRPRLRLVSLEIKLPQASIIAMALTPRNPSNCGMWSVFFIIFE